MKNWLKKHWCYHCWVGRWMPIDWHFRSSWWGTYKMGGWRGALTLISPLANTILNWKYRNYGLDIPDLKGENKE